MPGWTSVHGHHRARRADRAYATADPPIPAAGEPGGQHQPQRSGLAQRQDATAGTELSYVGVSDTLEVVLADAGYWHQVQMQRLMGDGLQVLIPPDASKRKGERPCWLGASTPSCVASWPPSAAKKLHARRQAMIEPVFGHTKFNRRCDRFLRRGRSACRPESRLINATHNLICSTSTPSRRWPPDRPPDASHRRISRFGAALTHDATRRVQPSTQQPPWKAVAARNASLERAIATNPSCQALLVIAVVVRSCSPSA
jgi:hypothetical protein